MAEYSLEQARDLAEIALSALANDPDDGGHRRRNGLYLGLLSMELSLKAALEKSGMSVHEIRKMSHRLYDLHRTFVDRCSFQYVCDEELPLETGRGAAVRDLRVECSSGYLTFGYLMHASNWPSIATYPNELRYGGKDPVHFEPKLVAELAAKLVAFLDRRFDTLKLDRDANTP
ncbi:MAG: hypothetical protein Q8S96_22590 [Hydrogenophaga sp.]|uniref:hypothetical protein n=1 Tax=Hydrogenophaga sp. TaxID=1904254 RepID=UPI00271F1C0B|nr:hypothetical protein [Hydrogenophaga sp.]MDO9482889.1 hypothetical protein [Hydrogenophaga sp.]MDP3347221.1 hypothetical protein [Hydrogenophaga sp.]MDP3808565.1 hypothetical protein [Hydrogenophaga sp.]MDP3926773.1 hypothetical protein [Hydrogenophaga sp.]MDZ4237481.1 hypothetical protein [Hydrogenophaga sp.]